jgi:hypothetical protein
MFLTTGEGVKVGISIYSNGNKVSFTSFSVASLVQVCSFDHTVFNGMSFTGDRSARKQSLGGGSSLNPKRTCVGIEDVIKFVSDLFDKWKSQDRLSVTKKSSPANH